ncbi:MAG: PIN domain-containing protein [Deltaproteobacteria bacterium]|nr:PIN domain-containing protein [Deltaproteobacteria bacterium]
MHLVDTNVLSELARPTPEPAVLQWLASRTAIAISVISIEELAYGIARAPAARRRKLAAWFDALLGSVDRVVDVTPAIARAAGELRSARDAVGRPVAQADMLICASALIHGLTLATRNPRDFEGCGVVIVDPFAA